MNCHELNTCPSEFQRRVTLAGGVNPYGEPNFKLMWMRNAYYMAGGQWAGNGQVTIKGYRELPHSFDPGWGIFQWNGPEKYGNSAVYYFQNCDEDTGLQVLGEYPWQGRYELLHPLVYRGVVNGRIVTEILPLSSFLIDVVVPMIKMADSMTPYKKRAFMLDRKAKQDAEQVRQIEDGLADRFPAFGGATFSAERGKCTTVVQKKMEAIEKHWRSAAKFLKSHGKGLSSR